MKYNKLDPFNEEDWDEKDVPQEDWKFNWNWNYNDIFDIPAAELVPEIFIRRFYGEYHFFVDCGDGFLKINNVLNYVNDVDIEDNDQFFENNETIRPNSSERRGLNRGKIKVDGFSIKQLKKLRRLNGYRIKI